MSKVLGCRSLSFAAVSLVFASAIGCGVEADASGTDTEAASAALTAGQSFLVSFTSGGIPANAGSLVAAAGGTIVARYNTVGAVLARSTSTSFAATLRATAGHRRRRQRRRGSQPDLARGEEDGEAPPHKSPRRRPAIPCRPPVGHGADPRAAGARDHQRQAVGDRRPVRLGRRHHAPGSRGPRRRRSASASLPRRRRQPGPGAWANDPIGHGTFTSGRRRRREEQRRHRRRRAGRHAGDGQGRRRRLQRSERRPGVRRTRSSAPSTGRSPTTGIWPTPA